MKFNRIKWQTAGFGIGMLFAITFIMPLFILNKPLVWDDWVWKHSSPEQMRSVAIQLGFWWLADLNAYIGSLRDPNLFLSMIAFCSNLLSIAVLSRSLTRLKILNDFQCGIWAFCCIVSPFIVVRYINSVAFYNLYFMFFIFAAYLFIFYENKLLKLLSSCLFIVSFSLNSLILAYLVIIFFAEKVFYKEFINSLRLVSLKSEHGLSNIYNLLRSRLFKIWPFAFLPLVFYLIRFFSPYNKNTESNPYQSYNLPHLEGFFTSPFVTLKKTLLFPFEVIYLVFAKEHSVILVLSLATAAVIIPLLFFIKNKFDRKTLADKVAALEQGTWRNVSLMFAFSYVLIFPYVLVNKPPLLQNFTEARHFIPAEPFVFALSILLISKACQAISNFIPRLKLVTLMVLIAFACICGWRSVFLVSTVWWETKLSNQIIKVIKHAKSDIKFWVFDDLTPNYLEWKRWNYVYTGFLISASGSKANFGISMEEYLQWKEPVMLLSDPYFRRRYNIGDYELEDSYNEVLIKPLKTIASNSLVMMYLLETLGFKYFNMDKLVRIDITSYFGCVEVYKSAFSTDLVNKSTVKTSLTPYCKLRLNGQCRAIIKGVQSVQLTRMESAYALQKYPSLLKDNTLHVIDTDSNVTKIIEMCMSLNVDYPLELKSDGLRD